MMGTMTASLKTCMPRSEGFGLTCITVCAATLLCYNRITGISEHSSYRRFLSFPRKRESVKGSCMDSLSRPGNDRKVNNERVS
jgi:hypothetical protein